MQDNHSWRRKHNRYVGYDYSKGGIYFVTICTKDKKELFGHIKSTNHPTLNIPQTAVFVPNKIGTMVEKSLCEIPSHYPNISIVRYCIMPNHIHTIFVIEDTTDNGVSLSQIISTFKTITSKKYKTITGSTDSLWQKSFYDTIIINGEQFDNAVNYIIDNPINWACGKEENFSRDM